MRTRLVVVAFVALVCVLPSCGGSSGGTSAPGTQCSDPNPSNLELTFAAIVCVQGQTSVPQSDGTTELKVQIMITDKDPNEFHVTTRDFKVVDSTGQGVVADPATANGRTGSGNCLNQQATETGWPLNPGASFTVPGPICFNLASGEHPRQLVWQDDVTVTLS